MITVTLIIRLGRDLFVGETRAIRPLAGVLDRDPTDVPFLIQIKEGILIQVLVSVTPAALNSMWSVSVSGNTEFSWLKRTVKERVMHRLSVGQQYNAQIPSVHPSPSGESGRPFE